MEINLQACVYIFHCFHYETLLVFIMHGGDDMLLIIFVLEEHKVEQLITF
jgi:hypothetical protein